MLVFSFHFSCSKSPKTKLRVAVASNAQFVTDSLARVFEKEYPVDIELIVSSSGKLTAQITHGAPYDLFLSADMKYPKSIYEKGIALTPPKVYAYGKLVLWTTQKLDLSEGLAVLKNPKVSKVAVANPEIAPYGVATISTLKALDLYDSIDKKMVYGSSISQVNQYQLTGVTNAAFTALSVVLSPALRNQGQYVIVPDSLYPSIEQGVILLKHAEKNNLKISTAFYDLLFSEKGKAVFTYFGYHVNKQKKYAN